MAYENPVDSPFNPNVLDQDQETLPLDEVIRRAIQAALLRARVMLPAKIVKVHGNQRIDVQPTLKTRYRDGTVVDLPVIQQVPVNMPVGNGWSIKLPIAVGDAGMLIFSDRSLSAWKASNGATVDPQDSRQHDYADPVFVPGLVPFSQQTQDATTDMVLTNGKAVFRVQKAGTFQAKNQQNELMDLLVQITTQCQSLSNTLSSDTVNTIFGPTKLNAFSTYQNIATQLQQLLDKLTTLKGS